MGKLFKISLIGLFLIAWGNLNAQDKQFSFGGGLSYLDETESVGAYAKGIYHFSEEWEGALTGTYYFEKYFNIYAVDADAHYVFYNNYDNLSIYALAGVNYLGYKLKDSYTDGDVFSGSDTGVNIGVGLRFKIGESFMINPAIKYITGVKFWGLSIGFIF